jgi:transcriptional regulator with XRE-family HTH domain
MLRGGVSMRETKQNPFTQALKRVRNKYGLSQFQLAIKLGKTPSKIAQYESGQRNPTRIGIAEIVEALKATQAEHDELLLAAGFLPEGELPLEVIESVQIVLGRNQSVPEEGRKQILDFIRAIKEQKNR